MRACEATVALAAPSFPSTTAFDTSTAFPSPPYAQRRPGVGRSLPTDANEASSAFLGNGDQGMLIRGNGTRNSLRFTLGASVPPGRQAAQAAIGSAQPPATPQHCKPRLPQRVFPLRSPVHGVPRTVAAAPGRTSLYDDREDGKPYAAGNFVVDRPRLPIGYFELVSQADVGAVGVAPRGTSRRPCQPPLSRRRGVSPSFFFDACAQGTMRTHLQNATTTLSYSTAAGALRVRAYSHARFDLADVQVVDIAASGDECKAQWRWTPLPANAHVGSLEAWGCRCRCGKEERSDAKRGQPLDLTAPGFAPPCTDQQVRLLRAQPPGRDHRRVGNHSDNLETP